MDDSTPYEGCAGAGGGETRRLVPQVKFEAIKEGRMGVVKEGYLAIRRSSQIRKFEAKKCLFLFVFGLFRTKVIKTSGPFPFCSILKAIYIYTY